MLSKTDETYIQLYKINKIIISWFDIPTDGVYKVHICHYTKHQ